MNKYIVENCECLYELNDGFICTITDNEDFCKDCTDCLIKQVIERCRLVQDKEYRKGSWKFRSPSKASFGREILQLFEIEECE